MTDRWINVALGAAVVISLALIASAFYAVATRLG